MSATVGVDHDQSQRKSCHDKPYGRHSLTNRCVDTAEACPAACPYARSRGSAAMASAAYPSDRQSSAQVLTASEQAALATEATSAWRTSAMRSTRRAPAPQWALRRFAAACVLLALAAPTVRGDAGATPPAVAVATAAELAAAVDNGAAHVVVTDHLDLSDLPVFSFDGAPTTDNDFFRKTFVSPSSLTSIRVRP